MNLFEGADPEVVGDAESTTRGDPVEWQQYADLALRAVASLEDEFTSESVWLMLGARYNERIAYLRAPDPHAMGQVFRRAQKAGICEPTERFSTAKRKDRHKGPQRIWRSLIR